MVTNKALYLQTTRIMSEMHVEVACSARVIDQKVAVGEVECMWWRDIDTYSFECKSPGSKNWSQAERIQSLRRASPLAYSFFSGGASMGEHPGSRVLLLPCSFPLFTFSNLFSIIFLHNKIFFLCKFKYFLIGVLFNHIFIEKSLFKIFFFP